MKSRKFSPSNGFYWAIAAVVGGAVATFAYVKSGPTLDNGLSPDERKAITFAFRYEKNIKNLQAFGQSLLPNWPVASKLLLDKAAKLSGGGPGGTSTAPAKSASPGAPGSVLSNVRPGGNISTRRISGVSVGLIYDLDNYTDAVSSVASTAVDVITHPADTVSGTWHAITHPADSFEAFANGLVDALHAIPGMDEAGELLKDFAKTGFGEWCLRIMATFGYYVLAPYLGSGLAAISFALPGVAKAEPFVQSWITETIDRVIKTINILLQQEGLRNIGTATSEAVNKALAENPAVQGYAKAFTEQIGQASTVLTDTLGAAIAQKLKEGASDALDSVLNKLKAEYGLPPDFSKLARQAGIREDNAAAAYDLIAKTHYQTSTVWDPVTGEDIEGHLRRARFRGVDRAGTSASAKAYQDPRLLTVQEAATRRAISVSSILNPPARQKWVLYYLNKKRYAEAGVKAKNATSVSGISVGYEMPANVPLQTGGYLVEFETQNPARVLELFRHNGIQAMGMRQIGPSRYRIFIRTNRPFQLRNLLGVRWMISRKLSL